MHKKLLALVVCTGLLFAGKYDKIVDNEGLDNVSGKYTTFIEEAISAFAGELDSAEVQKIRDAIAAELAPEKLHKEFVGLMKKTLTKDEVKHLKKLYKTHTFKRFEEIVEAIPNDSAYQMEVGKEVAMLMLQKQNEMEHRYFEYITQYAEEFPDDTKPLASFMGTLISSLNSRQPDYLQHTNEEMEALMERVDESIQMAVNEYLLLLMFVHLDRADDAILDEIMVIQFSEPTVTILRKIEDAEIAFMEKKMQKLAEKLGL